MSVRTEQSDALQMAVTNVAAHIDELISEASQCGFPRAADALRDVWVELDEARQHLADQE